MMTGHTFGAATGTGTAAQKTAGACLIQDTQSWLPLSRLKETDVMLLLTPAIAPDRYQPITSDPFEPLGKALAKYHPHVRHVPYIPQNKITGTHVVHIRLATQVVFVISGPPHYEQPSQVGMAEIVRATAEHRPHILILCCDIKQLGPIEGSFPTIIQTAGLTPLDQASAANLMVRSNKAAAGPGPNLQNLMMAPTRWLVELWQPLRDGGMESIYELWRQCFPDRFHVSQAQLNLLLRREGFARHLVVREPGSRLMLGFCATYTTYVSRDSDDMILGVAFLAVRSSYRNRGIGLSLHNHVLQYLSHEPSSIARLQLGSTFPRLLRGVPLGLPSEDWFRRRGWQMDLSAGQKVCDWLLSFEDWPLSMPTAPGLTFRGCELGEFDKVLDVVARESKREGHAGWYDQYIKLAYSAHVRDVVLGAEGNTVVAIAMTYAPNSGSPILEDHPWAATLGNDVLGVTCICILDQQAMRSINSDSIMISLLDWCVQNFSQQGMNKLFLDNIKGGDEGCFLATGFKKWAAYKDVWRPRPPV